MSTNEAISEAPPAAVFRGDRILPLKIAAWEATISRPQG